jgi:hypothetical protein
LENRSETAGAILAVDEELLPTALVHPAYGNGNRVRETKEALGCKISREAMLRREPAAK